MEKSDNTGFEHVIQSAVNTLGNDSVLLSFHVSKLLGKPLNVYGYLSVIQGTADIEVDSKEYTLSSNEMLIILPHQSVELVSMDSNTLINLLLVKESLFGQMVFVNKVYYQGLLYKHPILHIDSIDTARIHDAFQLIGYRMQEPPPYYDNRLVQIAVFTFLIELGNIIRRMTGEPYKADENDIIFKQFVELVPQYMKQHRDVEFYADMLHVSTQTLTDIVYDASYQSASKFIAERLYHEARLLLHRSDLTILDIADELGFSDQSAFGKFFKKHERITPAEFRKKHLI